MPERILIVHNYYTQPGGEDVVFENEKKLLLDHGHRVFTYTVDNHSLGACHPVVQFQRMIWNQQVYRELRTLIREVQPGMIHFHNMFPLLSSSAYYAAAAEGVPVVQTLHNYRLLCPNALLYRDGHVCEDCVDRIVPWPGVVHACYRGSRLETLGAAVMLGIHHLLGTWARKVDAYIALTGFAREQLVRGRLPADRIHIKPNFIQEPAVTSSDQPRSNGLYVGRLVEEKGICFLLDTWYDLGEVPLVILGDGPQRFHVEQALASGFPGDVKYLGAQPPGVVHEKMLQSQFLIFPSRWYEGFPITLIEAFAHSLAVIAPRLGAMSSLITDGVNGLHYTSGDMEDLKEKVRWAWRHPQEMKRMGAEARRTFLEHYSAGENYVQLMEIYHRAAAGRALKR